MTYQENGPVSAEPHRIVRHGLAAAAILAAGGLLAAACADNESSVFIRACLQPDDACTVEADPSTTAIGKGSLDGLVSREYICPLLVGNQVVERGSSDQLRSETSRITLYEADVRVVDVAGNTLQYGDGSLIEYTVPISGFVDPGSGDNPGYGIAFVPMVDGGSVDSIRSSQSGGTDVISIVKVKGRTTGGQELESAEWAFPIAVCFGCKCYDTNPSDCCDPNSTNPSCDNIDDVSTGGCSVGDRPSYDCRSVDMTCSEFAATAAP